MYTNRPYLCTSVTIIMIFVDYTLMDLRWGLSSSSSSSWKC